MAIVVMHLDLRVAENAPAALRSGPEAVEIIEAFADRISLVDAGAIQGDDAGSGAGESRLAAERLITEPARLVLAALDVIDAFVSSLNRHGDARVARRAQGHDLAYGHGQIRVHGARLIAPAPFVVLRVDDEPDRSTQRAPQLIAQLTIVDHAVDFRQEQGGETVAVHRAVEGAARVVEEAGHIGVLAAEDVADRAGDVLAVATSARLIAG